MTKYTSYFTCYFTPSGLSSITINLNLWILLTVSRIPLKDDQPCRKTIIYT
jgi:hypothetical protein